MITLVIAQIGSWAAARSMFVNAPRRRPDIDHGGGLAGGVSAWPEGPVTHGDLAPIRSANSVLSSSPGQELRKLAGVPTPAAPCRSRWRQASPADIGEKAPSSNLPPRVLGAFLFAEAVIAGFFRWASSWASRSAIVRLGMGCLPLCASIAIETGPAPDLTQEPARA